MSDGNHQHHSIDYIEFVVTDLGKAKRFYADSFGWEFNDYGPEYAGIKNNHSEGEVGGLRLDTKLTPGGYLVVLYSKDLVNSLENVKKAGGAITREIFEFPGGRRFQFTDPSGNELAVWSEN